MRKNKRRKMNIYERVSWLMIPFLIVFTNTIGIQASGLKITIKMDVALVNQNETEGIPKDIQLQDVPIGSTLKLSYTITNEGSSVQGLVSLTKAMGIVYRPYAAHVLTVNGVSQDADAYERFIGAQGLELTANQSNHIELLVTYTGAENGVLQSNILFRSAMGEYTSGFELHTSSKYKPKFLINFYDDNQILLSKAFFRNEELQIPAIKHREGYIFVGFNTKQDGSGTYVHGGKVKKAMNYYAIYKRKEYTVNYFIGDKPYKTEKVLYGENAPNLILEDTAYGVFVGWNKDLNNIISNIDVYALFKDEQGNIVIDKVKSNESNGKKLTWETVEKGEWKNGNKIAKYSLLLKKEQVNEQIENKSKEIPQSVVEIVQENKIPILWYALFLLGTWFFYKKFNKHRTHK